LPGPGRSTAVAGIEYRGPDPFRPLCRVPHGAAFTAFDDKACAPSCISLFGQQFHQLGHDLLQGGDQGPGRIEDEHAAAGHAETIGIRRPHMEGNVEPILGR